MPLPRATANLAKDFGALKSEYAGSIPSRFRRNRVGLFGSGDSHYANEFNFIRMREFVRDMDRNDFMVGQLVDRAVDNQVQQGYILRPDTGDPKIDKDLSARFTEWAADADACDTAGELTFADMERLTARAEFFDGDIFALPIDDGSLQLIEADRCRTPAKTKRNVVHGVLLDEYRKRLEFWFAPDNLNPYDRIYRVTDMDRVPARDADGNRMVFQVYRPNRTSQTRGVTALHAIFDICGMTEDVNFATLVKQQFAACVVYFLERTENYGSDFRTGERKTDTLDDSTTAITEGVSPGLFMKGAKGEKLVAQSPNIPSNEFFAHMRFLLQVIGVNLGMPLALALLDGKEGNFSSQRVIFDQAKLGFQCHQHRRARQFHIPVYRWKVRQWLTGDSALRSTARKTGIQIFRHKWQPPSWPYLQPLHDAQADKIRLENLLASPSQLAADDGREFADVVSETVRDNGDAIEAAIVRAAQIEARHGVKLHWRDVLNRALPQGVTEKEMLDDPGAVNDKAPKKTADSAPDSAPDEEE